MKRYLFLLILVLGLCISQPIQAQRNGSRIDKKESVEEQHSFYSKKLKLSDEQARQFNDIHKTFEKEAKALKASSDKNDFKSKFKALEQQRDQDIKAILSKRQFKRFVELRRKNRKNLQSLIRKQK